MYPVASIIDTSITGKPYIKNFAKLIGCPSREAKPATITFADAAISDPFPPKHEPSDNAHHTGIIASLPPIADSIDFKVGIIVATNGILSIKVDKTADPHNTANAAFCTLFCVK